MKTFISFTAGALLALTGFENYARAELGNQTGNLKLTSTNTLNLMASEYNLAVEVDYPNSARSNVCGMILKVDSLRSRPNNMLQVLRVITVGDPYRYMTELPIQILDDNTASISFLPPIDFGYYKSHSVTIFQAIDVRSTLKRELEYNLGVGTKLTVTAKKCNE